MWTDFLLQVSEVPRCWGTLTGCIHNEKYNHVFMQSLVISISSICQVSMLVSSILSNRAVIYMLIHNMLWNSIWPGPFDPDIQIDLVQFLTLVAN